MILLRLLAAVGRESHKPRALFCWRSRIADYMSGISDREYGRRGLRDSSRSPALEARRASMQVRTNSPNHFLASLSSEDQNQLRPHLKSVEMQQGHVLYR